MYGQVHYMSRFHTISTQSDVTECSTREDGRENLSINDASGSSWGTETWYEMGKECSVKQKMEVDTLMGERRNSTRREMKMNRSRKKMSGNMQKRRITSLDNSTGKSLDDDKDTENQTMLKIIFNTETCKIAFDPDTKK